MREEEKKIEAEKMKQRGGGCNMAGDGKARWEKGKKRYGEKEEAKSSGRQIYQRRGAGGGDGKQKKRWRGEKWI